MLKNAECSTFDLENYLAGRADPDAQLLVEQHIAECERCRHAMESSAADAAFWITASSNLDTRSEGDFSLSDEFWLQADNDQFIDMGLRSFLEHWLGPPEKPGSVGQLGKYNIQGIVGQGGMGLVLQAYDPSLKRMVAIKTLLPQFASHPSAQRRFSREAQLAAALRHPNIIDIYAVDSWRDVPYLVMPLVQGGTLSQLAKNRVLELDSILSIALQLANGLSAAHEHGMVHRDIEPSNILLNDSANKILICDFGLARSLDDEGLTHSGMFAGTPEFMSPEQTLGETVDSRSDLFSLGSLLYWLCTSKPPFQAENSFTILTKIVDEPHPPLRDLAPMLPIWFERLVDLLLAKKPDDRPQSAKQVAELLEACIAHRQDSARSLPKELRIKDSSRNRAWLRPTMVMAALACFCLINIGLGTVPKLPRHKPADRLTVRGSFPKSESIAVRVRPLDALEILSMTQDLRENERIQYWLERLTSLPVADIPPEILPEITRLQKHSESRVQILARTILDKNPFQTIEASDENPFKVVE